MEKLNQSSSRSWPFHIILNRKAEPVNRSYTEQAFYNQWNTETPLGGLDQITKMELGLDNEPHVSVRTSVLKRSLSFNTSIMKWKNCYNPYNTETTRGYHRAGPCT